MEPLVDPIVPTPDNTAAKIIGSGDIAGSFIKGFAAMAAANARKKDLELDGQKLVQAAAFHNDEVEHQKESLAQADMLARLRLDEQTAYHDDLITNGAARVAAMRNSVGQKQTLTDTRADFDARMNAYGLTDPNPKNPVDFYAKYQRLRDEFNWTTDPIIKHQLNLIDDTTKQHTIPLRIDGVPDPDDPTKIKFSNRAPRMVPVGEVVSSLMTHETRGDTLNLLKNNGLLEPGESTNGTTKTTATTVIGGVTVPGTFKEDIRKYLKDGLNVDYSRSTPSYRQSRSNGTRPNTEANNAATLPVPEGQAPAASAQDAMTGPGVQSAAVPQVQPFSTAQTPMAKGVDLAAGAGVKQALREGRITREQAVQQLRGLGFGE